MEPSEIRRTENVLLVNFITARIETLAPFYASTMRAWFSVNPSPLHVLTTVDELRQVPLWDP
jgi:hypothetical protein